jgi:hypothetical protein
MRPIGLTLKEEGTDKYGNKKQGDVMIIHRCEKCGKISINRIAADDDNEIILGLLEYNMDSKTKEELLNSSIFPLCKDNTDQVKISLVGKPV